MKILTKYCPICNKQLDFGYKSAYNCVDGDHRYIEHLTECSTGDVYEMDFTTKNYNVEISYTDNTTEIHTFVRPAYEEPIFVFPYCLDVDFAKLDELDEKIKTLIVFT